MKTEKNATVSVEKQTVTNEQGKVVKEIYHLKIATEKGELTIHTGTKNYDEVKRLTKI